MWGWCGRNADDADADANAVAADADEDVVAGSYLYLTSRLFPFSTSKIAKTAFVHPSVGLPITWGSIMPN